LKVGCSRKEVYESKVRGGSRRSGKTGTPFTGPGRKGYAENVDGSNDNEFLQY